MNSTKCCTLLQVNYYEDCTQLWTISNIMFVHLQQWQEPNQIWSLQTIKLLGPLGAILVEFIISKTFWMQVTWC